MLDELFKAIRGACSPLVWSQGVEIARGQNVVGERVSDAELVLRVSSPGKPVSSTVKLWPEEEDWLCDCGNGQKVCEHAAAAIIAVRRAREQGKPLPVSGLKRGFIEYVFSRSAGAISLRREIVLEEKRSPVQGSIASRLSAAASSGLAVNATKEDFAIDSFLGQTKPEGLRPAILAEVLNRLRGSELVTLDGEKIAVGEPVVGFSILLTDEGKGVRVAALPESGISETFANGAVIREGFLRARRTFELSPLESEIINRGKFFSEAELPELASRVLPSLQEKFPVEIRSQSLPRLDTEARPRLVYQTDASGDLLTVLPLIVYGSPPYARIDNGRLVRLGSSQVVPERNLGAETRLAAKLRSELGFTIGKRIEFRGEAAAKFTQRLRENPDAVMGNALNFFGTRAQLVPRVFFNDEQFGIEFHGAKGEWVDTRQVFQAWQQGLGRVALLGGEGWAPLPKDWLDRYGHRVLEILSTRDKEGNLPVYAQPGVARLCEEMETPCPPEFTRLRENLERFTGITQAALSPNLRAKLRPYQQRGVDWLAFLRSQGLHGLLADDMGLGKTLQTIALMEERVLVVAPTSVLPNWQKELARFRPDLNVSVYHGAGRELDPQAKITLTTYAILRLDVEKLSDVAWDMIVLDESQNIKNPESQVAQAAYRLKAAFRIALTGTPVENRLDDLWSQFHFLNPGLLGGRSRFQQRYSVETLRQTAAELRAKIKPFILRRLKQEVAPELPPRTDLVLYCDLEPEERDLYQAVLAAARKEALEALAQSGNILTALECLLRLRQAACHSGLLPGQTRAESSKLKILREKLEEVVSENHKALVFSQWTSLLDLIEPQLKSSKIGYARIDGSTRDRLSVVEQFQSPSGPPVLLMTLKAGGVGLNLTAADYVFLVDPWWNPAAEDQAADRAHRIGQERPVFVHRLVSRSTVEEKILALQEAKRAAAATALDGSDHAAGITRDDLLALLA